MVKYNYSPSSDNMNLIFHSLADPTRRAILKRLATQPLKVTEIAQPYDVSLPAISKHLKILEQAHLIKKEKQGREYTVYLQPKTLKTVEEYVAFYKKYWTTQLDNLEAFLKAGDK